MLCILLLFDVTFKTIEIELDWKTFDKSSSPPNLLQTLIYNL